MATETTFSKEQEKAIEKVRAENVVQRRIYEVDGPAAPTFETKMEKQSLLMDSIAREGKLYDAMTARYGKVLAWKMIQEGVDRAYADTI